MCSPDSDVPCVTLANMKLSHGIYLAFRISGVDLEADVLFRALTLPPKFGLASPMYERYLTRSILRILVIGEPPSH